MTLSEQQFGKMQWLQHLRLTALMQQGRTNHQKGKYGEITGKYQDDRIFQEEVNYKIKYKMLNLQTKCYHN